MPVPRGRQGVKMEMEKFKAGTLHSGSKKGPIVKNRKQAIAISLSEAGMSKKRKTDMRPHPKSDTHAFVAGRRA